MKSKKKAPAVSKKMEKSGKKEEDQVAAAKKRECKDKADKKEENKPAPTKKKDKGKTSAARASTGLLQDKQLKHRARPAVQKAVHLARKEKKDNLDKACCRQQEGRRGHFLMQRRRAKKKKRLCSRFLRYP